jgi:histidinol phosphatase-like PHP family hydrolase
VTLSNSEIAELLARAGEDAQSHRRRAYQRAAGHALTWPEEAGDVLERDGALTALPGIGDSLSRRISEWIEDPPEKPEPPPARSGFSTYARARTTVEGHPEWRSALRGDLQMHTDYSDGKATITEMALSAAARGYQYVAVTDHSQGLAVARGMDEARLAGQAEEVDGVNAQLRADGIDFVVLHAIEMNLDENGEGDMDPEVIEDLDLVVGSFHSRLRASEDQTDRYLAALANPQVKIIGHPTCRRFNRRPGLVADWSRIFGAAESSGKALEINSHPHRQDLSAELLERSKNFDITFSIGTDAHSTAELAFVETSLASAIETGIPSEQIVNFWPLERLLDWIAESTGAVT